MGDIRILLNCRRNTRGTRIYFFLPLVMMVSAVCPPVSQRDTSQTPQTLMLRSPHVVLVTVGSGAQISWFSNHDQ